MDDATLDKLTRLHGFHTRDELLGGCIQTTGIRRERRTSAPRRLRTTNVKGTKVSRETSLVMNMLPKKHNPTSTSVS